MNFKTTVEREKVAILNDGMTDIDGSYLPSNIVAYDGVDLGRQIEQAMTNAALAVIEEIENTDIRMSVVERARLKQIVKTLKASLTTSK